MAIHQCYPECVFWKNRSRTTQRWTRPELILPIHQARSDRTASHHQHKQNWMQNQSNCNFPHITLSSNVPTAGFSRSTFPTLKWHRKSVMKIGSRFWTLQIQAQKWALRRMYHSPSLWYLSFHLQLRKVWFAVRRYVDISVDLFS